FAAAQCPIIVDAGEDIYLCAPPTPTQLNGNIDGDYLNFSWSPTTGMSGSTSLTPTVSVSQTITYVLRARAADYSNNLIVNGDFGGGNSDFSSDYIFSPGDLVPEGVYDVLDNPQNSHPGFSPCQDHTGGGNMLAVNGSGTPNSNVWCQTITVMPNTQYVFQCWVATLVASSPAILQFSINGGLLGPAFNAPGSTCNWVRFFSTWNSGSNTSATICIVNQNTVLGGNDFALDDLLFAPTCEVTDSVTVNIINVAAAASPAVSMLPCEGAEVTLSGVGSSTGDNVTYEWDTPNGNIVSGANTLSPVVNAAGTYTITVTYEENGAICTKTASVNVIESPNPLAAWIVPPQPIGCGSSTTTLIGNSSQPGNSTYQWSTFNGNIISGFTSKNAVVDQPGTYTLVVTNTITGCTAEAEVTVTTATNPPVSVANALDTVTCINSQAALSGAGSTTGANISYTWSTPNGSLISGQNQLNAVAGAPGLYILTVLNSTNNCSTADTTTVLGDITPPVTDIQVPGVLDCDTDTLTISGTVLPTGATFAWTTASGGTIVSGNNTLTPQVTTTGIYTLTATNPVNGCTSSHSDTVTNNLTPPLAVVAMPDTLTCQQNSVILSGAGSSTGPNFGYAWTASSGGNIVAGANTLNPVVNAAGAYTLTVLDSINGCTASASALVAADTNIVSAVATAPDSLSCAVLNTQLSAAGSSTGPTITYAWSTLNGNIVSGADTGSPTADLPGLYSLLVSNTANGCSATDLAILVLDTSAAQLQITLPDTLTCAIPSISLTAQNLASGAFIYMWTASSSGNIVSGENTLNPVVDAAGTYTLLATSNTSGCTASVSTDVEIETGVPVVNIAVPDVLTCAVTTITLDGSASTTGSAITYAWNTTDGNIVSGANTSVAQADATGTYTLLVTNTNNGCTSTASITVSEDLAPPSVEAGNNDTLTCNLLSLTLQGSGAAPVTYAWTATLGGNIISGANTASPVIDAPGTYVLTVTSSLNGCTATDQVIVFNDDNAPLANAGASPTLTCLLTQTMLNGTGSSGAGISYQWSAVGGNIVSGANTLTPVIDAPGTYTLQVNNALNGCSSTSSVQVLEDIAVPTLDAGVAATLTCTTTQLSLTGSGTPGSGFAWTTLNGNIVSGANTLTPLVNSTGTYTLIATNPANGCTSTDNTTVGIDTMPPQTAITTPLELTCVLTNQTLQGTAQTGGDPFSTAWTAMGGGNIVSGGTTLSPVVDAPGTYTMTVTNTTNGCSDMSTTLVAEDIVPPVADAGATETITCDETSVTLDGSGSSTGPDFTLSWSGSGIVSGGTSPSPVVDEAGSYTITVLNIQNGCTASDNTLVDADTLAPTAVVATPGQLTCITNTVTLNANGSSPGANFVYQWTPTNGGNIVSGPTTLTPVVDASGSYLLTVENQTNGCTAQTQTQVTENTTPPTAEAGAAVLLHCNQSEDNLQGSSNAPGVQYTWSTTNGNIVSGANGATPLVNAAGTYQVTVTDPANGCTATDQTTASSVEPPAFDPTAVQPNCLDPRGDIDFGPVFGGAEPFRYSVDGGQTFQSSPIFGNLSSDTYNLVVEDVYGCTAMETISLQPPVEPTVALPEFVKISLGDSIQLQPVINMPVAQIASWAWTPSTGLSCSDCETPWAGPYVNTQYVLVITTPEGCTATDKVLVVVDRSRNVYAPNIFSPDGDGYNDRFTLFARGVVNIKQLRVYDRWGNALFLGENLMPNDESEGWDGSFRGDILNPGVFVWFAELEFIDGQTELFSGDVTIKR
ncbi:MAG: gliding motility-associated C-terminal domain-containing protein, partial [Saprospiraceae bacterium]|nr:gliding motility-associated C-terminal domain-containing protein [Saprospiraceae bacterium]